MFHNSRIINPYSIPISIKNILIGLFLFIYSISFGQNIHFRNYSVIDGLNSNTIWNIMQDQQGFMWFGTKNGLSRFDGYHFRNYQINSLATKNKSYGSSFIHSVCLIDDVTLWIGTEEGVFSFDLATEQYSKVTSIRDDLVFTILKDSKNGIWIGTKANGLYYFNSKNSIPINYQSQKDEINSISLNQIRRLAEDKEGNIWIGTFGEGIDIFNPITKKFTNIRAGNTANDISNNYIISLYTDKKGNVWIGTFAGGLNVYDIDTKSFKVYKHAGANSLSDDIVRAIYHKDDSTIYIGTEKGLNILNTKTNKINVYKKNLSDRSSLSDNAVYSIFEDDEGGMWVGTYFGGVNYFPSQSSAFNLFYDIGATNGLSGSAVSCFLEDKPGYLWVGTENGGLNYYDVKKGLFKQYPFSAGQEPLSYNNIHALYKDINGNIWVGTFSGGLNILNPKTGKVKKYFYTKDDESSLSSNSVYTIYEDRKGKVWVGTVKGLNIYDPKTDSFTRVHDMDLGNSCIYNVYEDIYGTIWVATYEQGLLGFNRYTNKWMRYDQNPSANAITSNKVIALMDDGKGNLWLGTDGGGLNRFNISSKKFENYGSEVGISNVVFGILQDESGIIWCSTNNGIIKFDPNQKKSWRYTNKSQLQSTLFNYNAYLRTSDGLMCFGGIYGFNTFHPRKVSAEPLSHRIAFTNFKLFNKEVNITEKSSPLDALLNFSDKINLSYEQSVISFEYAALHYKNPYSIHYAYKMDGFDEDWNYVGAQRIATYTNLPIGSYIFKVKSTDLHGNWNDDYIEIPVVINPPWYRTTIAYVFYVIFFVGCIYVLRNFLRKRQDLKNQARLDRMQIQQEKEFYNQKIEFFTTMAHEIRTPLSLIMAPLEKLKDDENITLQMQSQLQVMEDNTERLRSLIDQLLDFRRIESDIYTIRKEKMELVTYIQSIYAHFSPMANQKGIRFALSTDINELQLYADPEALHKILSNLLINAFKFTRSSIKIKIHAPEAISDTKNSIKISIIDDGVGIPQKYSEEVFKPFFKVHDKANNLHNIGGTGIGLSLAKSLVEKHAGTLHVESEEGIQTCFNITIPYELDFNSKSIMFDSIEVADNPVILVTEDDINMLEYIVSNLKNEGYQVIGSSNGLETLRLIENKSVDLIISDVMMPEIDGIELCRRIKNDVQYSHIPIILLTAKGNSETEISGLESGADAYILKPFKWKHLLVSIKNLMEVRQKLKEKFGQQPFVDLTELTTNAQDRKFIDQIVSIIEERISDCQFSVEELSSELAMSRSTLHKKLKAMSGYVPNEFIRLVRLKSAAKMLLNDDFTIAEVGYKNGFNSPSYFTRCFLQHFKLTPTEFIEKYSADIEISSKFDS